MLQKQRKYAFQAAQAGPKPGLPAAARQAQSQLLSVDF